MLTRMLHHTANGEPAEKPSRPTIVSRRAQAGRLAPAERRAELEQSQCAGRQPESDLLIVRVFGGSLPSNASDAERHLAAATARQPVRGIYQRSGALVRVARLPAATISDGIR